jgi:hypothetical protein
MRAVTQKGNTDIVFKLQWDYRRCGIKVQVRIEQCTALAVCLGARISHVTPAPPTVRRTAVVHASACTCIYGRLKCLPSAVAHASNNMMGFGGLAVQHDIQHRSPCSVGLVPAAGVDRSACPHGLCKLRFAGIG